MGAGSTGTPSRLTPGGSRPAGAYGVAATERPFRHEAILYADGEQGFVRETLPLVLETLRVGAPVMVAAGGERIEALREVLGADAARVVFADIRALGGNPARIIPAWREFLDRVPPLAGEPLGIGEHVWPGQVRAARDECARLEVLLDTAFAAGRAWRLVCPYDAEGLDEATLTNARRSHGCLIHGGSSEPNPEHAPPEPSEAAHPGELPRPPRDVWEIPFALADLTELRELVSAWAIREAMGNERAERLVLAVHELATNSIRHGGGMGMLRLWREGETLLCEVQDAGHIDDPLIGRVRPGTDPRRGRGLWIANTVCDLVQIRSSPRGSRIRLHMARA